MADVFISYKSKDKRFAKKVASGFRKAGLSVWWDTRLQTGEVYDERIEKELLNCKCVVVLWSKASVGSRWVRSEALVGDERGVLVPVMIEEVKLPVQFALVQTSKLIGWNGRTNGALWGSLLTEVKRVVSGKPRAGTQSKKQPVSSEELDAIFRKSLTGDYSELKDLPVHQSASVVFKIIIVSAVLWAIIIFAAMAFLN